jgi:hypothetical protein
MNRRDSLKFLAGATAFAGTAGMLGRGIAFAQAKPFTLPPLGYANEALEPHIDAKTMQIHHDNHHAAYVNNLNNNVDKWPDMATKPIDEILSNLAAVPEGVRGLVRNNVVVNLNAWADEAIEANGARNVRIEHNTVLVESAASPWSIGVRFSSASATVRNNLTNRRILERDGGRAVMEGNVMGATRAWFIDPTRADLHLSQEARRAIDAGVIIPDLPEDFDRGPRIAGQAPDAGAFEVRSDRGRPIR